MAGIPVVAVNTGAISQVVIDGKSGILTSDNSEDITFALRTLIVEHDLRSKFAQYSVKHIAEKFHIDIFVIEYSRIYTNIRLARL
jgi:glycosyltransferase involved in cell wall biosynthesis